MIEPRTFDYSRLHDPVCTCKRADKCLWTTFGKTFSPAVTLPRQSRSRRWDDYLAVHSSAIVQPNRTVAVPEPLYCLPHTLTALHTTPIWLLYFALNESQHLKSSWRPIFCSQRCIL